MRGIQVDIYDEHKLRWNLHAVSRLISDLHIPFEAKSCSLLASFLKIINDSMNSKTEYMHALKTGTFVVFFRFIDLYIRSFRGNVEI